MIYYGGGWGKFAYKNGRIFSPVAFVEPEEALGAQLLDKAALTERL